VNLALSVGAPNPPETVPGRPAMPSDRQLDGAALDFADDLALAASPDPQSHFDIAFAPDAPAPSPIDWPIEKD